MCAGGWMIFGTEAVTLGDILHYKLNMPNFVALK